MQILPVRNDIPAYNFTIELDSSTYFFEFRFNSRMDRWIMDINDENEEPVFVGIPVLVNQQLNKFDFPGIPPGSLFSMDDTGQQRQPNKELFSTGLKLFYLTLEETEEIDAQS